MKKKQLEDFYSGDAAWANNVEAARQQYWSGAEPALQQALLRAVGDDLSLAIMIYARLENGCLEWLDTPVPALGGRKPANCLGSEPLLRRLREALMRMD
jgi:hypothetical protein